MRHRRPLLTIRQILRWVDAHHAQTREWPHRGSGPVLGVPGETWNGVNKALQRGHRGLPAGGSLAKLLDRHRRGGKGHG